MPPVAVVDLIIQKDDKIVLIKRGRDPFKGMLALPGGHVKARELVEEAACREAREEISLEVKLKQILGVYSGPLRDPRYPTISTVFIAKPSAGKLKAAADAAKAFWKKTDLIKGRKLAFDHSKIISDYCEFKRSGRTGWSSRS